MEKKNRYILAMSILIIYGTRYGMTEKTAFLMSGTLINDFHQDVDVYQDKLPKSLREKVHSFDLVLVGSSIVAGRWKSGPRSFLKKYGKQAAALAIFVIAAGTINRAGSQMRSQASSDAKNRYIEPIKKKYGLETVLDGVFGGRFGRGEKVKYDNWKRDEIISWIGELARFLKV